ncbi:MAG: transposase [Nitrososphaerota archaeon]|nr:transposase [Nitrososphaerota archaeon]
MRIEEEPTPRLLMTNELLAHGFNPVLMRYLPELLCFEVKPYPVYPKLDYISLLVKASTLNGYAEGTSNVSRRLLSGRKGSRSVPTGETALSYFKTMDRYELLRVASMVFEEQVDDLKRGGLLSKPVPIAFDWHDQMFYGDKDSEMVNGTREKEGSMYAYQYLTASILVDGRRLTVILTPIKGTGLLLLYVEDALNRIRNMGVEVGYLLFDGGFSSLSLPRSLEEGGYTYVMRFTSNGVTKRMGLKDGGSSLYPCESPFRVVRADDPETGKSYLFATNMARRPKRVLRRYKRRWGVESAHREHNQFLARTTSKDYAVRLLYYAAAVCIYNAWCIFNAHQEGHVIALEVKVSLLLELLVPSSLDQTPRTDDHG